MSFAMVKNITCECGQYLMVGQPEAREMLDKQKALLGDGYSAIILDGSSAVCPKCGKGYHLPPAETFDQERHGMSELADWIGKLERGEVDHEPGNDIDFGNL